MIVHCRTCNLPRENPQQQSQGEIVAPRRGDFWLCPACGALHRFEIVGMTGRGAAIWGVRAAGADELEQLGQPDRGRLLEQQAKIRARAAS